MAPTSKHLLPPAARNDTTNKNKSAFFNNITYTAPKVPTLYTALTTGDEATNPAVYGGYTNSFVLEQGQIIQIVVNNLDSGRHPFHLHGHAFQALYRSVDEAGTFGDSNITEADFPAIPMRRDTLVLYPDGNIVLRFQANNPGMSRLTKFNFSSICVLLTDHSKASGSSTATSNGM